MENTINEGLEFGDGMHVPTTERGNLELGRNLKDTILKFPETALQNVREVFSKIKSLGKGEK